MAVLSTPSTVADREDILAAALGIGGESEFPKNAAQIGTGSQVLTARLLGFRVGDVINNVIVWVSQAATGAAPTGIYAAVYNNTARLAISGNEKSNAIFTTTGAAVIPLAASYTVTANAGLYLAFVQDGPFGGTNLNLTRDGNNSYLTGAIGSGLPRFVTQSGQASPPSPASWTAASHNVWFAWS